MIDLIEKLSRHIKFEFVRASGPGGQNVNKVSTAVQLRFFIHPSHLPGYVKINLFKNFKKQINSFGELIIFCSTERTQLRNKQIAVDKLEYILEKAYIIPKLRIDVKPTKIHNRKRIENKKKHGEVKKMRQKIKEY